MVEIRIRRGLALAWRYENPVLGPGEPGYETDTGRIKYGDGVTEWMSLGYYHDNKGDDGAIGPIGPPGVPGESGPVGPPGPPGNPGGQLNELIRSYGSPLQIWLWEHGLGTKALEVNVFEFDGITEKPAVVEFLDANTLRIEWYYAETGVIQILH